MSREKKTGVEDREHTEVIIGGENGRKHETKKYLIVILRITLLQEKLVY